jgi:hypothetical protein
LRQKVSHAVFDAPFAERRVRTTALTRTILRAGRQALRFIGASADESRKIEKAATLQSSSSAAGPWSFRREVLKNGSDFDAQARALVIHSLRAGVTLPPRHGHAPRLQNIINYKRRDKLNQMDPDPFWSYGLV